MENHALGYEFTSTDDRITLLQFADDALLLSHFVSSCQCLCHITDKFLEGSKISVKVSKCPTTAGCMRNSMIQRLILLVRLFHSWETVKRLF